MDVTQFLTEHGYWMVLVVALADQFGLPLPAAPFLIAAGAMAHDKLLRPDVLILLSVSASMVGHTSWYVAGRLRGLSMLRRVCALSLEPDACVQRTQDLFTQLGPWSLIVARFVPGLDTLAQPIAGISGMSWGRYLSLSLGGALLWSGTLIGMGDLFGSQLELFFRPVRHMGHTLAWLTGAACLIYAINKAYQRYRTLRDVRMDRISADELQTRMQAGETFVVFDLRHSFETKWHPYTIPGAVRLVRSELEKHLATLRPEQEVVLFCNCPHEIGSARMALTILRRGHRRVRPLEGGLDAWQERHFPLAPLKT